MSIDIYIYIHLHINIHIYIYIIIYIYIYWFCNLTGLSALQSCDISPSFHTGQLSSRFGRMEDHIHYIWIHLALFQICIDLSHFGTANFFLNFPWATGCAEKTSLL